MASEFKITRRVEFSETDTAGIVHYSNFFRYMESAEHAFFRSIGLSIVTKDADPPVGWPRVRTTCEFTRPLFFEDEFAVHLLVSEIRTKSISYQFRFRKLNVGEDDEVARGSLTVVCIVRDAKGQMKAVTIPGEIADKIEPASPERLAG